MVSPSAASSRRHSHARVDGNLTSEPSSAAPTDACVACAGRTNDDGPAVVRSGYVFALRTCTLPPPRTRLCHARPVRRESRAPTRSSTRLPDIVVWAHRAREAARGSSTPSVCWSDAVHADDEHEHGAPPDRNVRRSTLNPRASPRGAHARGVRCSPRSPIQAARSTQRAAGPRPARRSHQRAQPRTFVRRSGSSPSRLTRP